MINMDNNMENERNGGSHNVDPPIQVWQFFTKVNKEFAKCTKCESIVKTPRGGTSGLHYHAGTHGVVLKKTVQNTIRQRTERAEGMRQHYIA